MAKSNFSDILGKVKSGAGELGSKVKAGTAEAAEKVKAGTAEVAEKVKTGTVEAAGKVKETADGLIKSAQEKVRKKADADTPKGYSAETDVPPEEGAEAKENEPKVKLNDELRMATDQYNDAYTMMNDNGATLYRERTRAVDIIVHIEKLVNSIANRPKEFDTEISEIKTHRESFADACDFAKAELEAAKKSALTAGAGAAAGAAIVSVAPTAALWVATTFGTASTGTAISALSGAAASQAALAWLGGGALAVGGKGVIAGKAFLALAGPVGWGVAGVTLLSSIVIFSVNKIKLDKKKKEEIESIKSNTALARKVAAQIQELLDEVGSLRDKLNRQYNGCITNYEKDFTSISKEQQMQLGTLVNNTKSLAASLGKSIQ